MNLKQTDSFIYVLKSFYLIFITIFIIRVKRQINKEMNELHLDLDGGQASGNYETPYKRVVDEVKRYLRKERWTNIDVLVDICDGLKQHYANPRASLYQILNASWNSHFFERKPNTNEYRLRRE